MDCFVVTFSFLVVTSFTPILLKIGVKNVYHIFGKFCFKYVDVVSIYHFLEN